MKDPLKEPLLSTRGLATGYQLKRKKQLILSKDLDISLNHGEVVSLIGPNGAGKSTLLRTLCGVQLPLSGEVLVNGCNLRKILPRERAKLLSVVLTGRPNVGYLSGFSLVALGRFPHTGRFGGLSEKDRHAVSRALDDVGAADLAERAVYSLSDGEFQKLMIARALAQETEVIILDEPAAFLDLTRRVEMMELMRRIAREQGKGILVSSHDLELALRESDRIWLMNSSARVMQGAPEDLVLQGKLEESFKSDTVKFDRAHGLFVIPAQETRTASLAGGGIPAVWTRRALSRVGYEVILEPEKGIPHITIESGEDGYRWSLETDQDVRVFISLLDLVNELASAQGARQ